MLADYLGCLTENAAPGSEVGISVKAIETGEEIAVSYDVDYDFSEYGELILKIQVETMCY